MASLGSYTAYTTVGVDETVLLPASVALEGWRRKAIRRARIPSLGLQWAEDSRCLLQIGSGRMLV
jgi:hypothetical protein